MPLPTLSQVSLSSRTIFKHGTKVLAVYPSTTCFYSANIIKSPKTTQTKYTLRFDDDDGNEKHIEAENIMPYVQ